DAQQTGVDEGAQGFDRCLAGVGGLAAPAPEGADLPFELAVTRGGGELARADLAQLLAHAAQCGGGLVEPGLELGDRRTDGGVQLLVRGPEPGGPRPRLAVVLLTESAELGGLGGPVERPPAGGGRVGECTGGLPGLTQGHLVAG